MGEKATLAENRATSKKWTSIAHNQRHKADCLAAARVDAEVTWKRGNICIKFARHHTSTQLAGDEPGEVHFAILRFNLPFVEPRS